MCGICGFSGEKNRVLMFRMTDALRHRGPDDQGHYSDGSINLSMRRLSIVDLKTGKQPLANEDETLWVVSNGEIYNHLTIRKDLVSKGHRFRTDHSDTEVIIHLYEEYGDFWPLHVNGMFGTALWDGKRKRLLLYRDRIGKKPVYYSGNGGGIIFGSEIKAILQHPGVSRDLDFQAIYRYFQLKNLSAPSTVYRDIKQLMPGHFLLWEDGKITVRPYWKIDFSNPFSNINDTDACRHFFDLFQDAVKIRMQCDVPFGAYLSGGIDSSSVVSMMCRYHNKPIKTFCLGYEDPAEGQFEGKAQDMIYARAMSERLGTEHYEYIISADEFARELPNILSSFDEPFSGTISTYFLSMLIRKHVKVALSGDGADELFGSYLAHRLAFPIQRLLALQQRGVKAWHSLGEDDKRLLKPFDSQKQFVFLSQVASPDLAEWRNRLSVFNSMEMSQLLVADVLEASGNLDLSSPYHDLSEMLTGKDILNKSLEIDQRELLPNQVLPFIDRLSMAHSIEVRVPYLDYRIIEFANRLPGDFKIRDGVVKYIHKKTMARILPKDLIERPKEGFVQPIYSWMHGKLRGWVEDNLNELPEHIFRKEYIYRLSEEFRSGNTSINAKIWNLVCFNLWYRGILN